MCTKMVLLSVICHVQVLYTTDNIPVIAFNMDMCVSIGFVVQFQCLKFDRDPVRVDWLLNTSSNGEDFCSIAIYFANYCGSLGMSMFNHLDCKCVLFQNPFLWRI